MKKAILFDLDGTLWDSSLEVAVSWSMALKPYGVQLSQADIQSVMGKTEAEIAALFLPQYSPEEQKKIFAECTREEYKYLSAHGATMYPHLKETLETLSKDYALCIVSNCQEGYIETFLEYCALSSYFVDTECAGHTGRPKGDNIRMVLERNGFSRAVFVGDTQKDLDAAHVAGIPFIHAGYGFGKVEGTVPTIHTLSELPALIQQLLP